MTGAVSTARLGPGLTNGLPVLVAVGATLLGMGVGALPPPYGAVAIVGAAIAAAVAINDAWLTLYIAAYPLQGVSLFGVQAFGFRLSHVFFLVLLLVTVWRTLAGRRGPVLRFGMLDALVVAFVGYTVCSVAWSPAPLSISGVTGGKLILDLLVFLTLSGLVQHDPAAAFRRVAWGFAIAFLYMAGLSMYNLSEVGFRGLVASILLEQAATGTEALRNLNVAITSFTGAAGRGIIAAWMALGIMVIWGERSGAWSRMRKLERWTWVAAIASAAGYIVLSLSRGTWLSLIVAAPILWWRTGHHVRPRAVAWTLVGGGIVAAAMVASGLWGVLVARVSVASSAVDVGVSTRLETWRSVLGVFAEHPIFGIGIKGTESLSRGITVDAGNPHNVYIQVLGELGLMGALLFASLAGYVLWRLWRCGTVLRSPLNRLADGVFLGICCYLVQSMVQSEFMDLGIWTLLGLGAGLIHLSVKTPLVQPAP